MPTHLEPEQKFLYLGIIDDLLSTLSTTDILFKAWPEKLNSLRSSPISDATQATHRFQNLHLAVSITNSKQNYKGAGARDMQVTEMSIRFWSSFSASSRTQNRVTSRMAMVPPLRPSTTRLSYSFT